MQAQSGGGASRRHRAWRRAVAGGLIAALFFVGAGCAGFVLTGAPARLVGAVALFMLSATAICAVLAGLRERARLAREREARTFAQRPSPHESPEAEAARARHNVAAFFAARGRAR